MSNKKDSLKFVIIGHVDHGKSTLIGRLLYDTNSLSPEKIMEMEKCSSDLGRKSEFAFILDHLEEERSQGITIDTAQIFFDTPEREYVIIDAPGHVEFVKNMITGASQADAAILIVSGKEGMQEQTRRHSYILSLLGIKQVAVAVNLWEDQLPGAEDDFKKIKKEIEEFFGKINISAGCIVPIVATEGDNIASKSERFKWYRGETILEVLADFKSAPVLEEKPLYFAVQDVYKIEDKRIYAGRVESGFLKEEQKINIYPEKTSTTVKSIEKFQESVSEAGPGEAAGFTTADPVFIDRGNIICEAGFQPYITKEFQASIFWMNKKPLKAGEIVVLKCACQEVSAHLEIKKIINSSTLEEQNRTENNLENLEVAEAIVKMKKSVVVTKFSNIQEIGRFVLLRDDDICAGGIITQIL